VAIKVEADTLQGSVTKLASMVRQGDTPKDGTWRLDFGAPDGQRGTVDVPDNLAREMVATASGEEDLVRHVSTFAGL